MNAYTNSQAVLLAPSCAGVYLRWLSPLGNEEGWLFQGDIDERPTVTDPARVDSADGRRAVAIRRPVTLTRTLRAGHLTDQQFDALSTVLDSPAVWVQTAGGERTPVYVVPGSLTRTTGDGRHVAQLDIEPPRRNALAN